MDEWEGEGEGGVDYDRLMSVQDCAREDSMLEQVGYREGMAAGQGDSAGLQAGFDQGYSATAHMAYHVGVLRGIAAALAALLQQLEQQQSIPAAAGPSEAPPLEGLQAALTASCAARDDLCRVLERIAGAGGKQGAQPGSGSAGSEEEGLAQGGSGSSSSSSSSTREAVSVDLHSVREQLSGAVQAIRGVLQWGALGALGSEGLQAISAKVAASEGSLALL